MLMSIARFSDPAVFMKSKRLGLLLALVLFFTGLVYVQWNYSQKISDWWTLQQDPPLPGVNSVSKLKLVQVGQDQWRATFDYYYTGAPLRTLASIEQRNEIGGTLHISRIGTQLAHRGTHQVTIAVVRPSGAEVASRTREVIAQLTADGWTPSASAKVAQVIEHPDAETVQARSDKVMERAVRWIDAGSGDGLRAAKTELEKLVAREPGFDPAYVELARIAMKSHWSPEGLRDAEALLKSALQIRPDSVEAKVLLGYVFAHQKRYADAEPLFAQAEQAGTKNLWLWTNWGELLQMQGRDDDAIAKYREAIARPPTGDTNDRARQWAFNALLRMQEGRKDLAAMESLHQQRIKDYPEKDCMVASYGQFLVLQRGDAGAALKVLKPGTGQCNNFTGTQMLGAAHYLTWADGKDPERAESLRQARVFLPAGPLMFYVLAQSDGSVAVAQKLIAAGDRIGIQDSNRLDALAYALRTSDSAAVRRLLKLGARTDTLIGEEKMPVALMPVLLGDVESVRILQRAGVDYTRLRYQGTTAVDFARERGDGDLLKALDPKGAGPKANSA
jgi:tetratricopeptide (TPR) repeat protein